MQVFQSGCSSMVELQPSKLIAWVRFPSPAPCILDGGLLQMICQSCAMVLKKSDQKGTNTDGTPSGKYCINCFVEGKFTKEITMEQMADIYVEEAVKLGEKKEDAQQRANNVFPSLERYK